MGMSPIGAFIYYCEKDIYKISMRSHLKDTDVGHVCQIFGGGGHRSAAAFAKSKAFFDELLINKIDLTKELKKYK
jgi:nanoRNase/pAp phosphatase (c-di-AMP/oligoRNAs hydrolase)